jgi:excinuclease UvrABC nuclease subunit
MIKKDAEFGHIGKRGSNNRSAGKGVGSATDFNVRAEAYDIAHMSGKDMVGVMVVMHDGDFAKDQYKKFNIRGIKSSNDTGALKQVLERRFSHIRNTDESSNWPIPTHIVLDGGVAQLNVAEEVLNNFNIKDVCLVAVTKDDKHKAKEILRSSRFNFEHKDSADGASKYDADSGKSAIFDNGDIISLNQECHRFAIATHRKRRSLSRGL